MKIKYVVLIVLSSFFLGFQLNGMLATYHPKEVGSVTSIGGIFFKCKNPKEVRNWYKENLGFNINDYGAVFEWRQGADSSKKGFTQWSAFNEKTKYFLHNRSFHLFKMNRASSLSFNYFSNEQINCNLKILKNHQILSAYLATSCPAEN